MEEGRIGEIRKGREEAVSGGQGGQGRNKIGGDCGGGKGRQDKKRKEKRRDERLEKEEFGKVRKEDNENQRIRVGSKCSRSQWRAANGSKRMYLDYTHGLFIT